MIVNIDQHFIMRIRERVDQTLSESDIKNYTLDALEFGLKMPDILNKKFKQHLFRLLKKYNYTSDFRILDGYVFVFDAFTATAITIYPVPYWAIYEREFRG